MTETAKPATIYHTGRMHFFAYDGFLMYTFECEDNDFKQSFVCNRVLEPSMERVISYMDDLPETFFLLGFIRENNVC